MRGEPVYALYCGENWLIDGTTKEIAVWLNRSISTVRNLVSKPTNRLSLYYLGREKELEQEALKGLDKYAS